MQALESIFRHEGVVTWMYLDTAIPPVVTTGAGLALFTLQDCLALPWDKPADIVRRDYQIVKAAQPGLPASRYRCLTSSRITEEFARQAALKKLEEFRSIFGRYVPGYPNFPPPAQAALDDLMYNLGPHFPVARKNGKQVWPKLTAAIRAQDWKTAAKECWRGGISEARNQEIQNLFLEAANV